ncbi:MAG TPA: CvpA family protein [Verrucomicrobiae bacterium]|nr:CvpA family protein [Verrucomicrobiae bacterium]
MTIWILALVLLAAGAGLGFRQGAIRTAISFVGIVTAVLFAGILGNLLKPLLPHVGIHDRTLIWLIAPVEAFVIVLVVFKIAALIVHRKVNLYYKYKAGDLRLALWERLNSRLGLCVGLLNGTAYLLLISFVIYNFSYWTVQIAPSGNEARTTRIINQLGHDLETTGLASTARSIAPLPDMYYKLADLAGLVCQNPQLSSRLANYPALLSLAERPDMQQLAQNNDFIQAWKQGAPMGQILNNPQVKGLLQNRDLIDTVWEILRANLDDLVVYLKTGKSPKYDSEKLLGRWGFNVNVSVGTLLIARSNIPAAEIKALRSLWSRAYAQTMFVAAADHQAFLENMPRFKVENGMATVAQTTTWQGQWNNAGTNYDLSLNGKSMTARTDGLRLTIKSASDVWVFDRAQ